MEVIGIVTSISTSDGVFNLVVSDKDKAITHLKIMPNEAENIKIGKAYSFKYEAVYGPERVSYRVTSFTNVEDLPFELQDETLRLFFKGSPLSIDDAEKEISKYIDKIDNPIVKDITKYLIDLYHDQYYIYPAAAKMHHAYIGGLAHHSIGMLHMSEGFIDNYPFLNKDYVYAGIMLHDIGKAIELSGAVHTEYTVKGQLLGHLVLGAIEISNAAAHLGYQNKEEAMLLEHMLISHHGVPQFGSPKKPLTAEALVLWYIDTIDSKFRVLGEELERTKNGEFTEAIGVIDKSKIYKPQ